MGPITVSAAAAQFLEYAAAVVAPSTVALYRLYLTRLCAAFGTRELSSLTPAEVRTWGVSFHPLQAAQRLTRWAFLEARLVDRDPLAGLKKGATGRRLRTLSPEETARLARQSHAHLRHFVIALRETIARPHELRQVTWAQVYTAGLRPFTADDLAAGRAFFFLDTFKGQSRRRDRTAVRVIPISPRLGRMLVRLRRAGPELRACVFENCRRRPWTINAVRCSFRRLRVRAGLGVDHRGENVVAYTLRHSSATAAVVRGVPLAELAGAMGHSDVRMTSRYVHLSPAFLAQVHARIRNRRK